MQSKKTAIVSGASSGIGRAVALRLAKEGYTLAVIARRKDLLTTLKKEIEATYSVPVHVYDGDLSKIEVIEGFFAMVDQNLGEITLAVNSAGLILHDTVHEMSDQELGQIVSTNVLGSLFFIKQVLRRFEKQNYGHLFQVSSSTAIRPFQGAEVYAATKAALYHLMTSLQDRYSEWPLIRLTQIIPGATLTESFKTKSEVNKNHIILPDDIANLVAETIKLPKNFKLTELRLRQAGKL